MKIKQFIMIRKFVPVNETVTDFCCVLNFRGMEVPNSVLKYFLASHIHDFKHKMLQFFLLKYSSMSMTIYRKVATNYSAS